MNQIHHDHFHVLPATATGVLKNSPTSVLDRDQDGSRLMRRLDEAPVGAEQNPVSGFLSTMDQENVREFLQPMRKSTEKSAFDVVREFFGGGSKTPAPGSAPSIAPKSSIRSSGPKPPAPSR